MVVGVKAAPRPAVRRKPKLIEVLAEMSGTLEIMEAFKRKAEEAERQYRAVQASYIKQVNDLLKAHPELREAVKQVGFTSSAGQQMIATYVERNASLKIDDVKLMRVLGDRWRRVTIRVLDKGRLESAVDSGVVSDEEIRQCSTMVPAGEPYLRLAVDKAAQAKSEKKPLARKKSA